MKKILKNLLDQKPVDTAVSAVYFAVRIIRHQKNMLLENIQSESSIEEKKLGMEIVNEISKQAKKLVSNFTQNEVNKYIVELSSYIEERNKDFNRALSTSKQDVLKNWRSESVHKYENRDYERKFKPTVFISYQSDQELSMTIKKFLLDLKIEVITWDPPSFDQNRNVFSSFIEVSSLTDLAIFILTKTSNRLRENQIFELGYLLGKLGRENVIIFADEFSSIPSDLAGLKLLNSKSGDWKYELAVQMDLAGFRFEKRGLKK